MSRRWLLSWVDAKIWQENFVNCWRARSRLYRSQNSVMLAEASEWRLTGRDPRARDARGPDVLELRAVLQRQPGQRFDPNLDLSLGCKQDFGRM